MNFIVLTTISSQTVIITPRYSGQILRLGATEVVASAEEPVRIYGTGTVEISEGYWDNFAVVEGNYTGPYFDGSTSPTTDLTPSWTGTANASASVLTGTGVAGAPTHLGAFNLSSKWAAAGARSLRIIPRDAGSNSYVDLGGGPGGLRYGMEAGKTYTILARGRLATAQTGTLGANARRLSVYHRVGSGGYTSVLSAGEQFPNVPGEYEVRLTVTLPAGTTEAWPRLFNGAAAGGGDVWWDNLVIVEGNYTGPWFDGSNAPAGTYAMWDGAPDASTSTLRQIPDDAVTPGWMPGRGVPQVVVDDPAETLQLVTDREILADYTITLREVG